MLEKIGFMVLGALVPFALYFIKRAVEKKPQMEHLERHQKLLDINKQMIEQGVSHEDIKDLENILIGKSVSIKKHKAELEREETPLQAGMEYQNLNQTELNEQASNKFEFAREDMQRVLNGLRQLKDSEELERLDAAQSAWEAYAFEQAQAAAATYRGGSIYPLIFFSELEATAIDRAARLQAELNELRRLGN